MSKNENGTDVAVITQLLLQLQAVLLQLLLQLLSSLLLLASSLTRLRPAAETERNRDAATGFLPAQESWVQSH